MEKIHNSKMPFYDKKDVFTIYDDKFVLHKMGGQVIRFDDVFNIIFNRIDFSLYLIKPKRYYTIVHMKNGDAFEITIPITGYYALKNYYENDKKTKGRFVVYASVFLSVWAFVALVFLAYTIIYWW